MSKWKLLLLGMGICIFPWVCLAFAIGSVIFCVIATFLVIIFSPILVPAFIFFLCLAFVVIVACLVVLCAFIILCLICPSLRRTVISCLSTIFWGLWDLLSAFLPLPSLQDGGESVEISPTKQARTEDYCSSSSGGTPAEIRGGTSTTPSGKVLVSSPQLSPPYVVTKRPAPTTAPDSTHDPTTHEEPTTETTTQKGDDVVTKDHEKGGVVVEDDGETTDATNVSSATVSTSSPEREGEEGLLVVVQPGAKDAPGGLPRKRGRRRKKKN
eukprot:TRINITY_DN75166_c0_g1_i1.p1 TRINITY_DN75166_c0_g1~~TRINITY_DN75166_c0_g1_i1.p1  ORF type:complete len:269 (-),score=23.78 TRINITY_DN75166_c0_g1_i1:32-838(-)